MKKIRSFFIILCLSAFSLSSLGKGTDSLRINKLEERTKLLEDYNNQILEKRFETETTALSSKINTELDKAKEEVIDQLWIIKIIGTAISILLAISVGTLVYKYFIGIRKTVEKLLHAKLQSHLNENTQVITDLITSHKTENIIRSQKKIHVIAGDDTERTNTDTLLKSMGFKNCNVVITTQYEQIPVADLYVISNINGSMPEALVLEFMEKSEDSTDFVYYGGRLAVDQNKSYSSRVNFANSKYTLYHQIINTLAFKLIYNG